MKIIPNQFRFNYPFDPALNFEFEKTKLEGEGTLVISVANKDYVAGLNGKKIFLNLEEPNAFWNPNFRFSEDMFDRILSICKFSTKYYQREQKNTGQYVFFPLNLRFIHENLDRKYDLVYSGHLDRKSVRNLLKNLVDEGLNLCVISNSQDKLVTHRGVSHSHKMQLIAESKFAIVHNQLFVTRENVLNLVKDFQDFKSHGAFSHFAISNEKLLDLQNFELPQSIKVIANLGQLAGNLVGFRHRKVRERVQSFWLDQEIERVPQLKSRLFEAAGCGTVPIVIQDPWNLVNDWFTTEEYVSAREDELKEQILNCLANYSSFTELSNHLREKTAREYSTHAFVEKFL